MRTVAELAKINNENLFREYLKETDDIRKEEIKEEIFKKNEKFSWHIANKYNTPELSKDERFALANFGMLKAFNSFDPEKGIRFATYASRCMENEILMELRKIRTRRGGINLETVVAEEDGNELSLLDLLSSSTSNDIKRVEQRKVISEVLKLAKTYLDEKELIVFLNVISDTPKHQKEIAKELDLSQSYISRLERRALETVREMAIIKKLIEPHEFSGSGIKKLPKPEKLEEPEASPVVESPVIIRHISEIEGAGEDMKKTLKEQVQYFMDKHPEMGGKEIAEALNRPKGSIYSYMSLINREKKGKETVKPKLEADTVWKPVEESKKESLLNKEKIDEIKKLVSIKEPTQEFLNQIKETFEKQPTSTIETVKEAQPAQIDLQMTDAPSELIKQITNSIYMNIKDGERYNFCIHLERVK